MNASSNKTLGIQSVMANHDLEIVFNGGISMYFRKIEMGSFRMGSRGFRPDEEPMHTLLIPDQFYLGYFPVTQKQFARWTATQGIEHENHFKGDGCLPAERVTWFQAKAFCRWLTESSELRDLGLFADLPSEAHWEYACKTGPGSEAKFGEPQTEFFNGDGQPCLEKVGWYIENAAGKTHPVGELAPNGRGLYDMHGNVWEWCQDVWAGGYYRMQVDGSKAQTNRSNLKDHSPRVMRGGCWRYSAAFCRSSFRGKGNLGNRLGRRGFRVCLLYGTEVR